MNEKLDYGKIYKYQCRRCGKNFKTKFKLDSDARPVCDDCFKIIINSKTAVQYKELLSIIYEYEKL
jgi:DNA-directed RNA polymerase subunit RPC12/RpoP